MKAKTVKTTRISPIEQRAAMDIAGTMLDRGEVPDRKSLKEFMKNGGVNLDPVTTAWCAGFVNASLAQAGIEGTNKLNARSFMEFGTAVDKPKKGDIAVFSRGPKKGWKGHVAFYAGTNPDGSIHVMGGNQGNKVSYADIPADRLLGFRRAPAPMDFGPAPTSASGGLLAPDRTAMPQGFSGGVLSPSSTVAARSVSPLAAFANMFSPVSAAQASEGVSAPLSDERTFDKSGIGLARDLTGPLTGLGVPGMSIPKDTASPHRMANLGGLAGYLDAQQGASPSAPATERFSPTDIGTPAQSGNFVRSLVGRPALDQSVASFTPSGSLPTDVYSRAPSSLFSPGLLGPAQTFRDQPPQPGFEPATPSITDPVLSAGIPAPALSQPHKVKNYNVAESPTIADPGIDPDLPMAGTETTIDDYPAVPDEPKESVLGPALKSAALGGLLGGPMGAVMGLLGPQLGKGLGALGNPAYGPASVGRNVGSGLAGINAGMYGARGDTGYSRSQPGVSVTSRGRNLGYDLSNQYGVRTTYDANGNMMGNSSTLGAWGKALGGLLGGKKSDKGKGLGGINGSGYSGRGLY